jgi:hypothetical protein
MTVNRQQTEDKKIRGLFQSGTWAQVLLFDILDIPLFFNGCHHKKSEESIVIEAPKIKNA